MVGVTSSSSSSSDYSLKKMVVSVHLLGLAVFRG